MGDQRLSFTIPKLIPGQTGSFTNSNPSFPLPASSPKSCAHHGSLVEPGSHGGVSAPVDWDYMYLASRRQM